MAWDYEEKLWTKLGRLPQLCGFVCAYHPAAPGLNLKHTIYAFIQFVLLKLYWEKDENKQKRDRDWPI